MTPCQIQLRETPAAAAARAAAQHFYAVRQRRRCLSNGDHPEIVKGGSPTAGVLRGHRRSRPGRLRDRLRAVSHRIRIRKAIEAGMISSMADADRRAGGMADSWGVGGAGPSSTSSRSNKQLLKPMRWAKKEFKVTDKLMKSLESVLFDFKCSCIEDWIVAARDRRGSPLMERITKTFEKKDLISTELYKNARLMASVLDDMVVRDNMSIMSVLKSKGAEHLFRGLVGLELALGPVTSVETLVLARWPLADALNLHMADLVPGPMKRARVEGTKREANRRRLKRLLKKWGKPSGSYFMVMCDKMRIEHDEEDLRHVCAELKISYFGY